MTAALPRQQVRTRIWHEEPEPDNSFATRSALCHGYDVYGDMLGQARWVDMLFLLLRGEAPSADQARLLDAVGLALANPGPRDAAVHAAMCAGVGGSTSAAVLIAALSVGAGKSGGAREVWAAMQLFNDCGRSPSAWERALAAPAAERAGIWPQADHPPGFDPHAAQAGGIVQRTLRVLATLSVGTCLPWLAQSRTQLETATGRGLAMTGVARLLSSTWASRPTRARCCTCCCDCPARPRTRWNNATRDTRASRSSHWTYGTPPELRHERPRSAPEQRRLHDHPRGSGLRRHPRRLPWP